MDGLRFSKVESIAFGDDSECKIILGENFKKALREWLAEELQAIADKKCDNG